FGLVCEGILEKVRYLLLHWSDQNDGLALLIETLQGVTVNLEIVAVVVEVSELLGRAIDRTTLGPAVFRLGFAVFEILVVLLGIRLCILDGLEPVIRRTFGVGNPQQVRTALCIGTPLLNLVVEAVAIGGQVAVCAPNRPTELVRLLGLTVLLLILGNTL